jgi:hypothetical protein
VALRASGACSTALLVFALAGGCTKPSAPGPGWIEITGYKPTPPEKLVLARLQAAACLRAPTSTRCAPGLRVRFGADDGSEVACQEGQPVGRFLRYREGVDVTGPIPQSSWEAIARVVEATGGCIAVQGKPARVERNGKPVVCARHPFEVGQLLAQTARLAAAGPPPAVAEPVQHHGAICEIDPGACPPGIPQRQVCPALRSDPWAGLRRPAPVGDRQTAGELDAEGEGPSEAAEAGMSSMSDEDRARLIKLLSDAVRRARKCTSGLDGRVRVALALSEDRVVQDVSVRDAPAERPDVAPCLRRTFVGLSLPGAPQSLGVTVSPP